MSHDFRISCADVYYEQGSKEDVLHPTSLPHQFRGSKNQPGFVPAAWNKLRSIPRRDREGSHTDL